MPSPYETARERFRELATAAGISRSASDALLGIAGRLAHLRETTRQPAEPCPMAGEAVSYCETCHDFAGSHRPVSTYMSLRARLERAAVNVYAYAHVNANRLELTLDATTLVVPTREG